MIGMELIGGPMDGERIQLGDGWQWFEIQRMAEWFPLAPLPPGSSPLYETVPILRGWYVWQTAADLDAHVMRWQGWL